MSIEKISDQRVRITESTERFVDVSGLEHEINILENKLKAKRSELADIKKELNKR